MTHENDTADPVPPDAARKWDATPTGIATTLVGIGSVVGLVGWPTETGYALCALAGLLALVAGVLRLRGELTAREPATVTTARVREWLKGTQCARQAGLILAPDPSGQDPDAAGQQTADLADLLGRTVTVTNPDLPVSWRGRLIALADQPSLVLERPSGRQITLPQAFRVEAEGQRPDLSGPDPDTARTTPDTPGQDAADQDGHHPDDIRTALPIRLQKALDADPTLRAEYERVRLMLHASRDERQRLRDELAALHDGEQPYTNEALVPTPAQWIWRWNRATPAQRLEYATRAITAADRLHTVNSVLIGATGRDDLTGEGVIARVRVALDAPSPAEEG